MADEENLEQDKLKEFIDSVDIAIPSEVWAELRPNFTWNRNVNTIDKLF